jgi:hypothetical protein
MLPIVLGGNPSTNKFKLCSRCNNEKPPEGGIDMGSKWQCQSCWRQQTTTGTWRRK